MDDTNKNQIEKTLKVSFQEGMFASGMSGFTQEYFAPFLLLLGAAAREIGILNSLPNFFASLAQLKSADITEKIKSRKKIINVFVLLQALVLLPILALSLMKNSNPYFFIFLVIFFGVFGAIATPAWGSLMSDLVAKRKWGEYFGWRTRMLGFVMVGTSFLAGLILYLMKKINVFYGFALIFALAFVFRMISWWYLQKMHEPPLEYKKENYFSFIDFIRRLRESNFAKFVLFVSMVNFSVNLASPFFVVFMLRDLHFNYLLYSLITATATLMVYLMIGRWGRHADKVGNLKIIRFTSQFIGFIPLLWVLNHNPVFLFFAQIFSGFLWAGFNICTTNFIYDAVTPEKRTRCIAYFNVINGLALCIGALLGGFLLNRLPPMRGYKILTLFSISAFLRLAVSSYMPRKLKEVRTIQKVKSYKLFFSVIGLKPLLGIDRKTIQIE